MPIRLDGTNTTANPGITGADADTGLQFGTDEIQLVTGGTNRATVESNGNFTIEDGNLVVAAGHGIDFSADANATGMTSELLEDYEEGTWTPTASVGTLSTNHQARYVKIGNMVVVSAIFHQFSNITSTSGIHISGLPFARASYDQQNIGAAFIRYVSMTRDYLIAYLDASSTISFFGCSLSDQNYDQLDYQHLTSTTNSQLRTTIVYYTD